MQDVKRSFRAVSKDGVLKRVCCGPKKPGGRTGYTTSGESSSTPFRSDRGHPCSFNGYPSEKKERVLAVVPVESCPNIQPSEKKLKLIWEPIAFNDDNLEGTIQPHNDALMVIAQINGFVGSSAEVMYPDLFRGLGLKNEDLSKYDTPLVGFDGRMVISKGQILLPINMEVKEVMVTFIVVNSFSLYTTILRRLWIHAMGAVPSTLHIKVKFYTEHGITIVRGN